MVSEMLCFHNIKSYDYFQKLFGIFKRSTSFIESIRNEVQKRHETPITTVSSLTLAQMPTDHSTQLLTTQVQPSNDSVQMSVSCDNAVAKTPLELSREINTSPQASMSKRTQHSIEVNSERSSQYGKAAEESATATTTEHQAKRSLKPGLKPSWNRTNKVPDNFSPKNLRPRKNTPYF